MTWSIQPVGPRPADPPAVGAIDRSRKVQEREPRDEDDRRQGGQPDRQPHPDPPVADADGHIDVLA